LQKKDKFFDKIVKKNYNDKLEKVLEKKYFEEDAKSLLLSMLYKIEAAYNDYAQVKQNVETKDEFIENIIESVRKNCDTIKLVKPNSEESGIIGNKTFLVEKKTKRIICYPIERKLLYSIAKINKNEKIIKDEYFLIDKTLSNLINVGNNINVVEPLRDFNGYSWTTIDREIESIEHNLIYQNLMILLGNEFLNNWIKNKEYIIDYMELLKNKLEEKYTKKISAEFIEMLTKLSILLEIKFSNKSKNEILKLKEELESDLERIDDSQEFIVLLTKEKRQLTQEIKKIDETINNKTMLEEEYIRRNEKLDLKEKIFSIRILSKMMTEEREQKIEKIEEINKLLIPQNYIKYKKDLKEKYKYVKLVETQDIEKDIIVLIIKLQKVFLKCYEVLIETAETKQEMTKLIYQYRYYCMLPFKPHENINEQEKLQNDIKDIGMLLIQKAHKLKLINNIAKDEEINYQILKSIFNIRIINLEELYIKITKEKDKFYIQLFDDNIFEEKIEIENFGNLSKKDLEYKIGKKVKIFN